MPETPDGEPVGEKDADGTRTFKLERSFNLGGQLPLDTLPPETIERLRAGGELTEAEEQMLRSAVLADSGIAGRLLGAALSSGVLSEQAAGTDQAEIPAELRGHPDAVVVPGRTRRFEWKWGGNAESGEARPEPATYYELLSGRPDPNREFFITARRLLNIAVWVIALGIPLGIVTLGIATRQSSETIVFMGIFGLIIGAMIRTSFPRTPFG